MKTEFPVKVDGIVVGDGEACQALGVLECPTDQKADQHGSKFFPAPWFGSHDILEAADVAAFENSRFR